LQANANSHTDTENDLCLGKIEMLCRQSSAAWEATAPKQRPRSAAATATTAMVGLLAAGQQRDLDAASSQIARAQVRAFWS
jgi:hypothetical protein